MKKTRVLALVMVLIFVISLVSGCTKTDDPEATVAVPPTATQAPEGTETPVDDGKFPFPMDETMEISIMSAIDTAVYNYVGEPETQLKFYKTLEEMFNLGFNLTFFPDTGAETQVQIAINTGDLPDIVHNLPSYYANGLSGALEENIIIDIAEYWDALTYYPALFEEDTTLSYDLVTEDGQVGVFSKIYAENYGVLSGLAIRKDWLDALNLNVPATYDDWSEVLAAFQTEYDPLYSLRVPFSGVFPSDNFTSGFGTAAYYQAVGFNASPFYISGGKDGTVFFGGGQDSTKEYLQLLNKWYELGYFSSDFMIETNDMTPEITTDNAGAFTTTAENFSALKEKSVSSDTFELVAVSDPWKDSVGSDYVNHNKSRVSPDVWSVTTNCKNPKEVCQLVDWLYSEEGSILVNYGVQGEGFEFNENGEPELTDFVLRNPDGISNTVALYIMGGNPVAPALFYLDKNWKYYNENQSAALGIFNRQSTSSDNYKFPANATMNQTEQEQYDSVMPDILTFISENFLKFITGEKSLDEWDSYVNTIIEMGIDKAVEAKQSALDRYTSAR